MTLKIETMYAYIATDEDGNEGVAAQLTKMGWMPLVGADKDRMMSLRPYAEALAHAGGQDMKLVQFENRVELETIEHDPSKKDGGTVVFDPEKGLL